MIFFTSTIKRFIIKKIKLVNLLRIFVNNWIKSNFISIDMTKNYITLNIFYYLIKTLHTYIKCSPIPLKRLREIVISVNNYFISKTYTVYTFLAKFHF